MPYREWWSNRSCLAVRLLALDAADFTFIALKESKILSNHPFNQLILSSEILLTPRYI
jgi:hypothetical protein